MATVAIEIAELTLRKMAADPDPTAEAVTAIVALAGAHKPCTPKSAKTS